MVKKQSWAFSRRMYEIDRYLEREKATMKTEEQKERPLSGHFRRAGFRACRVLPDEVLSSGIHSGVQLFSSLYAVHLVMTK